MKKVHEGLSILLRYQPEGGEFHAEHDEIFAAGPAPQEMASGDARRLRELGWDYSVKFESWKKFT
jgi:hypothetical protein